MELQKKISDILKKYIKPKSVLLLGVSGGADSMVLFTILAGLQKELDFSLVAAHLNHSLRGKESDDDQNLVTSYVEKFNVPLVLKVADVTSYSKEHKLGIEESGRDIRYAFFKEVAVQYKVNFIVTAHHSDDFVETIVMNIVRGAGLSGLSGFLEIQGSIIRPMIYAVKDEIYEFAKINNVPFREDKSNKDTKYRRNFVREKVVPLLCEINPDVRSALLQQGQILQEIDRFLLREASLWCETQEKSSENNYSRDGFKLLDPALEKAILRFLYRSLYGNERNLTFDLIISACSLILEGKSGKWIKFGSKYVLKISFNQFLIEPFTSDLVVSEEGKEIPVPSDFDFNDSKVSVQVLSEPGKDLSKEAIYADFDKILDGKIFVRGWKPGDRFKPLGMEGRKKLQDFFSDNRVPRSIRQRMPIFCDKNDNILAVSSLRISDDVKIDKNTKRVLKIVVR